MTTLYLSFDETIRKLQIGNFKLNVRVFYLMFERNFRGFPRIEVRGDMQFGAYSAVFYLKDKELFAEECKQKGIQFNITTEAHSGVSFFTMTEDFNF